MMDNQYIYDHLQNTFKQDMIDYLVVHSYKIILNLSLWLSYYLLFHNTYMQFDYDVFVVKSHHMI